MIGRDYIMRMVEQLSQVLVQIAFQKKNKNFDAAQIETNTALKRITGIEPQIINSLSADGIITLLKIGDRFEWGRGFVIARLLKERAEIGELLEEEPEDCRALYHKSLHLYLESALVSGDLAPENYADDVDEIVEKLNWDVLPFPLI